MSMTQTLLALLDGGKVALCMVVALAFVRLGVRAKERLYYAFAISFLLLATSWLLIALRSAHGDGASLAYLPRLCAFLLIIAAIVDRNRRPDR
jgi:hypothetical protein